MDVGLKKDTVELKPYNPRWKELFEEEKKLLLDKFPDKFLEISHGGSTAVPGMPAKPIIDMFAAVSSLAVADEIRGELEGMGYEYRGEEGVPGRILYVKKGKPELRTHHLQLVEKDHDEWKNHILLRDFYIKHPKVAKEYAKLKTSLAEQYPNDRVAYRGAKDAFVKNVLRMAKSERGL